MNMATKKDIFAEHLEEYLKADKQKKGDILAHVCFVTGMHGKSAIRRFKRLQMTHAGRPERRGRPLIYTPDVTVALKTIWETGAEVCGELLHPMTNEYIDILTRDDMWPYSPEVTQKLRQMSEGTIKQRVGKFMKARKRRNGIGTTKPSHLKHIIPIFTGPWQGKPPGFGQIDTVRHSNSASGDAVHTVNYTDAATYLVIPRAQFNKGEQATKDSMEVIYERMPFPWLGAHPDSGSEFINYFVKDFCDEKKIALSRSRANHKNDNMYVEERNGHVIRRYISYVRLDCVEAVDALNEVYDVLTPYLLHFVAVKRMTGKLKVQAKYQRTYEKKAKTPYMRIMGHPAVSDTVKAKLRTEHTILNPLILKKEIDQKISILYAVQKEYGTHWRD